MVVLLNPSNSQHSYHIYHPIGVFGNIDGRTSALILMEAPMVGVVKRKQWEPLFNGLLADQFVHYVQWL